MDLEAARKQIAHYFNTVNPRQFAKDLEHEYPELVVQKGLKKKRTTRLKLKRLIKKLKR